MRARLFSFLAVILVLVWAVSGPAGATGPPPAQAPNASAALTAPAGPAGPPPWTGEAYLHASLTYNTDGDSTYLDNPLLNGQPNAKVLVMPQSTPYGFGSLAADETQGVWYNPIRHQWGIFNENFDNMLTNQAWAVFVPPPGDTALVQTTTVTNTAGGASFIDNPALNGHPEAILFVEHVYDPPGALQNTFTRSVGTVYSNVRQQWAIQTLDNQPLPAGKTFFVYKAGPGQVSYRHTTTAANHHAEAGTGLDNALINGNPDALIFVAHDAGTTSALNLHTPRYSLTYEPFQLAWLVENEDASTMDDGFRMNVLIIPPKAGFLLQLVSGAGSSNSQIDNPDLNFNPYARLIVSHNQNPSETGSFQTDNHPIGVFYKTAFARWYVYNRDFAPLTPGTAFNVYYTWPQGNSFVISANTANTATLGTRAMLVNSPALNSHASAVAIASYTKDPDGVLSADYTAEVGLKYLSNFWRLFNTSGPDFPFALAYNVYVPPAADSLVVTGTFGLHGNLFGSRLYIDSPLTNGDPSARVFVTQQDNGGLLNTSTVGVNYNDGQWAINNEDGSAIPAGAVFHVFLYHAHQVRLPLVRR